MAERILLDCRCPHCNEILVGNEEVRHVNRIARKIIVCKCCKHTVIANEPRKDHLGLHAWYETEDKSAFLKQPAK